MIKIYYVECDDDCLIEKQHELEEICAIFKRGNGYANNYFDYEDFKVWKYTTSHEECADIVVLTNDLDILEYSKDDTWNDETHRYEIYIYQNKTDGFMNVHDLTEHFIRRGHNIRKMYIAGAFNKK